jgi:predicted nucleic acid-binding protein
VKYVVDASIAVEYLLRTAIGRQAAPLLQDAILLAPELLDVEVLSVLRRAVLRQRLEEQRALLALADLVAWPVDRIPHRELAMEAWRLRQNVSAYDAFYVAAARLYEATLLTADGPLSRAPNVGIMIHNIWLG